MPKKQKRSKTGASQDTQKAAEVLVSFANGQKWSPSQKGICQFCPEDKNEHNLASLATLDSFLCCEKCWPADAGPFIEVSIPGIGVHTPKKKQVTVDVSTIDTTSLDPSISLSELEHSAKDTHMEQMDTGRAEVIKSPVDVRKMLRRNRKENYDAITEKEKRREKQYEDQSSLFTSYLGTIKQHTSKVTNNYSSVLAKYDRYLEGYQETTNLYLKIAKEQQRLLALETKKHQTEKSTESKKRK